jgi:hypothetical protein
MKVSSKPARYMYDCQNVAMGPLSVAENVTKAAESSATDTPEARLIKSTGWKSSFYLINAVLRDPTSVSAKLW